jgi:penicillin-insensitive murein endopeptidase
MLRDPFNVDPNVWTPRHTQLVKLAASYRTVERIFVHPAIKQVLCDQAGGDRAWLWKVRPWWNHHYHFHVRLSCPLDNGSCQAQRPVSRGDGCGGELNGWFARLLEAERQRAKPAKPTPASRPLTLSDLPGVCRAVLTYGDAAPTQGRRTDKPAGPPPPRLHFPSGIPHTAPPSHQGNNLPWR